MSRGDRQPIPGCAAALVVLSVTLLGNGAAAQERQQPGEERDAAGGVAAAAAPTASPAAAAVADAKSQYGRFEYRNKGEDCEIWFTATSGASTKLIEASFCGDPQMMMQIEEVKSFGGQPLPVLTKSAEEIHFFLIPGPGGSGDVGCDYRAIVVNANKAWASEIFQLSVCAGDEDDEVESVTLTDGPAGASLSFVAEGTSYELTMGSLKSTPIPTKPTKPRSVVSDERVVRRGELEGGSHADGWLYSVVTGTGTYLIDDSGKCELDGLGGDVVEVTGKVRTWSDGRTEFTCTAVRRAPPSKAELAEARRVRTEQEAAHDAAERAKQAAGRMKKAKALTTPSPRAQRAPPHRSSRCPTAHRWCGTASMGTCCSSYQACCMRPGGNPYCAGGTNPCGR